MSTEAMASVVPSVHVALIDPEPKPAPSRPAAFVLPAAESEGMVEHSLLPPSSPRSERGRRLSFISCSSSDEEGEDLSGHSHDESDHGTHANADQLLEFEQIHHLLQSIRPVLAAKDGASHTHHLSRPEPSRRESDSSTTSDHSELPILDRLDWCIQQIGEYVTRRRFSTANTREKIQLRLRHKLEKARYLGGEDAEIARWVASNYVTRPMRASYASGASGGCSPVLPRKQHHLRHPQMSDHGSSESLNGSRGGSPEPSTEPSANRSYYQLVSTSRAASSEQLPVMISLQRHEDGRSTTVEEVSVGSKEWRTLTRRSRRRRWAQRDKKQSEAAPNEAAPAAGGSGLGAAGPFARRRTSLETDYGAYADDEQDSNRDSSRPRSTASLKELPVCPDVQEALERIDGWGMDVFDLDERSQGRPLTYMSMKVLENQKLDFQLDPMVSFNFFKAVEDKYGRYPAQSYHNNIHAADVTHATYNLLRDPIFDGVYSDLEILAATVAAAVHDVAHPGVTNQFLVATQSDLAVLYNDESVLENFHVATAFKLMQQEELNIVANLRDAEKKEFRRIVIKMVLSTDMAKHFESLGDFRALVNNRSQQRSAPGQGIDLSNATAEERMTVLCAIIHLADLSASTKPWELCHTWCTRLLDEFFRQGDEERRLGLEVGALHDRQKTSIPSSQTGFVDFILLPLWETWDTMVGDSEQLKMLVANRARWQAIHDEQQQPPDAGDAANTPSSPPQAAPRPASPGRPVPEIVVPQAVVTLSPSPGRHVSIL